jgi:hypothetical protein
LRLVAGGQGGQKRTGGLAKRNDGPLPVSRIPAAVTDAPGAVAIMPKTQKSSLGTRLPPPLSSPRLDSVLASPATSLILEPGGGNETALQSSRRTS